MRNPTWCRIALVAGVLLLLGLAALIDLAIVESELIYQGDATGAEVAAAIQASPVHRTAEAYVPFLAFPLAYAAGVLLEDALRSDSETISAIALLVQFVGVVLNAVLYACALVWLWNAVRANKPGARPQV